MFTDARGPRGGGGAGARRHELKLAASPRAEVSRVAAEPAECQCDIDRLATRCSVDKFARDGRGASRRRSRQQRSVMFRFINKNLVVGSVEMAEVDRDIGVGVVEQPVPRSPFDVYRESHHLLTLAGSIGMRSSLKHETWGRRGSHLRMCVDLLGVSLLSLLFSLLYFTGKLFFPLHCISRDFYSVLGHTHSFARSARNDMGSGYVNYARYDGHVGLMFDSCVTSR